MLELRTTILKPVRRLSEYWRRRAEPIFRGSGGGRGGGGLGLGAAAFGGCQENAPFAHYGIVFSHHSPAHPVY